MYALKFTGEFHCGILEEHDIEISTCGSILASVSTMKIKSKFSFLFFQVLAKDTIFYFKQGFYRTKFFCISYCAFRGLNDHSTVKQQ